MFERARAVLDADARIAYALIFGSAAGEAAHVHSDVDIAIDLTSGCQLTALDIGELISKLESSLGRTVDLVLLGETPPSLAYRIFRDGVVLNVRDERMLKTRRAQAILEYLDYRPIEELFIRGVLRTRDGR